MSCDTPGGLARCSQESAPQHPEEGIPHPPKHRTMSRHAWDPKEPGNLRSQMPIGEVEVGIIEAFRLAQGPMESCSFLRGLGRGTVCGNKIPLRYR